MGRSRKNNNVDDDDDDDCLSLVRLVFCLFATLCVHKDNSNINTNTTNNNNSSR